MPTVHELDVPELNLEQLGSTSQRQAALDAARDQHWLARNPFGYAVLRYEDCVAILRDRRFHSAAGLITSMAGLPDDHPMNRDRRESILSMEGPGHDRLRRLAAPAFTPMAADKLRPFMRSVVNELVDVFAPSGKCELVRDVCEPYPIPIICELLGAPKEDWRLFSRWATDLLAIFNGNLLEDGARIMAARDALDEYVGALIERRRSSPGDDLLTAMIAAESQGDRLSSDELLMMAQAVLVAGTDTTRNQLACAVALFADHPDQWRLLADDPSVAQRAVEESMRVLGAVRGTARFASTDIEYRDIVFPQGTLVFPSFVSANADRHVWTEPEHFDITKPPASQPHLTFGSGIHYCLGANLARAELQEALPILARRLPDLVIDGQIDWKPTTMGIWGPERVPLRFTPAD